MLQFHRDPSGDLARLRCDRCRRVSTLFLFGVRTDPAALDHVRSWLRMHDGADGWSLLASEEDGRAVTLDLCPRCTRRRKTTTRPDTEET